MESNKSNDFNQVASFKTPIVPVRPGARSYESSKAGETACAILASPLSAVVGTGAFARQRGPGIGRRRRRLCAFLGEMGTQNS